MRTGQWMQIDPPCEMVGSQGMHTDSYYDFEGGRCEWCGRTRKEEDDDDDAVPAVP